MNFRRINLSLALFSCIFLLFACREKIKTSNAYLIRSNHVHFDEYRQNILKETNANKVYIKIFDVVFNEWQQRPLPLAQVEFDINSLKWLKTSGIEIVPMLYINNDLLEKINPERVNALADRVMLLLKTRLDQFDILDVKAIHIDCDWSVASKEKYFDLLTYLEPLPYFANKRISVAVRPKQVENSGQFGIPPVKEVIYTLDLQDEKFDPSSIEKYPLTLDLSIPVSNDPVVFRNKAAMGPISGLPDSTWQNAKVSQKTGDYFEVIKDTVVHFHYLKKGDQIEAKKGDTAALGKITGLIRDHLKSPESTIIFNQLDSVKIRQYNTSQLKAAFDSFNKN